jgi:nucleoside-diphosphate-sugar epimerase
MMTQHTTASLEGARALVTGGAGLVGSHIVDQLLAEGVEKVVVLDNFIRGRWENLEAALHSDRVQVVEGDVRDNEVVRRCTDGCDYVFHQAAIRITLCAERPRDCIEVMVNGTFNVLEACVQSNVQKVVLASSASVYGMAEQFPTNERHHLYNNRTLYGAVKVTNEQVARAFNEMYGLSYVALRYFNIYGPRMDVTGAYTEVFIRWLDCIDRHERPKIFGDGSQTMDFIYISDVARANLLAMQSGASDEVFNVASGRETSLLELWQTLERVTKASPLDPEFLPERQVNNVRRRLGGVKRAAEQLGFQATVDLEEGLRQLIAWRQAELQQGRRITA